MAVRPFVPWPDARLKTPAADVAAITEDIIAIWDDMVDTMEAMPGRGVGLAAVQIGVMQRLAVVDASRDRGQAIRMANPEVIAASETTRAYEEASPNLPGHHARITRPDRVTVAYTDHLGIRVRKEFEGLWATSVQHQIDHLAGRMYFDRLSKLKRDMFLRRVRKAG
jgi:peptide deformylase